MLPFNDGAFDLALCSHFPFLYSTQLGEAFHRAALREMCRVAVEVGVFPLLAHIGRPHVAASCPKAEDHVSGDVLVGQKAAQGASSDSCRAHAPSRPDAQ